MALVKMEYMEVKVEDHDIEMEPLKYDHYNIFEKYTFNNSCRPIITIKDTTAKHKKRYLGRFSDSK